MVYEEDIESAVSVAVKTLGPMGQYSISDRLNVHIHSGDLGVIWYGDTDDSDIDQLATVLQREVTVTHRSDSGEKSPRVIYTAYPSN